MSRLTVKLVLAFLLVAVVGIGLAAFFSGWTTEQQFMRFALHRRLGEMQEALADYYAVHGEWSPGVEKLLQPGWGAHGFGRRQWHSVALADARGTIVVEGARYRAGEQVSDEILAAGWPVTVDGERVGTLLDGATLAAQAPSEQDFVGQMRRALALGGLGAAAIALVVGVVLARGFTRPLRQLAAASRAVAMGDLDARVPVRSQDELGQLAAAFNQMAIDLAHAEKARQQQVADIAHELRTPLTVIQGHLEALADGIFPADQENLEPVLEQAHLLARLVEDLRTLSLADAGRLALSPAPVDVADWAAGTVASFRSVAAEREITLDLEIAAGLPTLKMDTRRMAQVLGNLLDNALRYTPQGGRVTVRADWADEDVVISVADTGAGVLPEHLPHLFERFWRGDRSRSRRTGGSGLGLAIARQIVESHGGHVWAENLPGGGLKVSFSLPATSTARPEAAG